MTANSFGSRATVESGGASYEIYRLDAVPGSETLPYSLKVLLENLLRNEDGDNITAAHIEALAGWDPEKKPDTEIQFTPVRSCRMTRAGVNWISVSGSAAGSQFASAVMCAAVMLAPSSLRSRFSSRTFRLYGRVSLPATASRR